MRVDQKWLQGQSCKSILAIQVFSVFQSFLFFVFCLVFSFFFFFGVCVSVCDCELAISNELLLLSVNSTRKQPMEFSTKENSKSI